jgi:hypothetical protein
MKNKVDKRQVNVSKKATNKRESTFKCVMNGEEGEGNKAKTPPTPPQSTDEMQRNKTLSNK